jgi:sugar phosphate isomerase/epimerase
LPKEHPEMTTESAPAKPGRIGLCCYSLLRRVRCEQPWLRFQQIDFPKEAKRVFGLDTVEVYSGFLESHDRRYLDRIREQAKEEGVCLHGMAVDMPYSDICALDEAERKVAVAQNMVYVPVAARLGLAYYRINTGGQNPPTAQEIEQATKSLKELTDVASARGIRIAFENHGGLSLSPAAVQQIIEAVGKDRMCTLPDIGNFGKGEDAYEKVGQMMPYAVAIHAKIHTFDESGEATNISLKRMVEVVAKSGFKGPWSIETTAPDAWHTNENILKSKALLEKYLG